ncbi:acetyl-CoA synthase subunit delta, partial [Clostridioides difficile]
VGNSPKIGIQISDVYPESWTDSYKELYKDVANCPVEWAKYVEANTQADFICLKFDGSDPNGLDKSVDECADVAKAVIEAIKLPLVVAGSGNHEKMVNY